MRKNHSGKSSTRQPANFDNLSRPLYEEGLDLFGYQDDAYLEQPIKIETRHSNRRRRHSDSYSEDLHIDLFREEKQPAMESEEQLLNQRNYDPIEELLLPLEQHEISEGPQFPAELANLHQLPLEEVGQVEEHLRASETEDTVALSQKKALLKVINNFQAYNHSLLIAMNFHNLLKKDAVTKMYGSILGVLKKEGNKMETALIEEIRTLTEQLKTEKKENLPETEKKELQKTGEVDVIVKEEYIE